MKKVLLIHHWSSIGGSGISLFNTWQSLKHHYNVVGYIPVNPPSLSEFLTSKGLHAKTYSFTCGQLPYYSGGSHLLKPGFWYLLVNALIQIPYWKKVIEKENPDLIIVNSKVLCWMGLMFKNRKSLCFVRETVKGRPSNPINKLMKRMLEKFTLVSFLSEFDLNQTGLKRATTIVSPDFLYLEDYFDKIGREKACKKLKVNSNSFNVGFVGGIDKLKGIDIAIQAINHLKNENINLLVAGNDIGESINSDSSNIFTKLLKKKSKKFTKEIKSYIDNNGLNDKITFVGVQKDISTLYSASDVLIFPMKDPHQARPAFEIGAQKKPVIITDFPNIREFIVHNKNGFTFEPNNTKDLAKAILKLKNDRNLLEKLGACNYEYTMKFHTEPYAMSKLISKINKILN